jgi:integrase
VQSRNNRIPKINIEENSGGIRLRFQYQHKQYRLTTGGLYNDPIALANARTIAETIKRDILLGQFDRTLQKYLPEVKQPSNVISPHIPHPNCHNR